MHGVLKNVPMVEAIDWYQASAAGRSELRPFHTSDYIDELASIPMGESVAFYSTTIFGTGSFDICCMASGMAICAARHVFEGKGRQAYALVRSPGLERAAVIDWDVHHGNGTQESGYAISYAAYCLHATLDGVLNRPPGLSDPLAYMSDSALGLDALINQLKLHPVFSD